MEGLDNYISFEPTYEELKQEVGVILGTEGLLFWAYLWGIETGYGIRWDRDQASFEPTYEELKHGLTTEEIAEKIIVLSLPMRNWNRNIIHLWALKSL